MLIQLKRLTSIVLCNTAMHTYFMLTTLACGTGVVSGGCTLVFLLIYGCRKNSLSHNNSWGLLWFACNSFASWEDSYLLAEQYGNLQRGIQGLQDSCQ